MFIPIRTDRPPRRKPRVTEGLIIINLLVYLSGLVAQAAGWFSSEQMVTWGHFDPQHVRIWQVFTSLFMHDPHDIWHIAFNMLFLWVFGSAVEDRLGRFGFLCFYLIGGGIANLAHGMLSPNPVIGASGAIAGVTGAFFALFPRSRISVLVFFIMIGVVHIPSLWFVGFYFIVDLLRQVTDLMGHGGGRVAYMAHIAGYIYGFSLSFILLATKIIKREEFDIFFLFTQARRRAAFRAVNQGAGGAWESASADTARRLEAEAKKRVESAEKNKLLEQRAEVNRLLAANDLAGAAHRYRELLRNAPDTVLSEQRQLEIANQFYSEEDFAHAAAAYELLLDRYPRCTKAPEVRLILGVLYTRQLKRPERAREVIESAKPSLHDPRQTALADDLLAELK